MDNFTTDPNGSAAGQQWFAVLSQATATFSQTDDQSLTVRSTLPGDRRQATWTLRLELDPGSGRIATVAPTPNRPIWALGQTEVTAARHGTVLSAGLDAAATQQWAERLDRAAVAVSKADPAGDSGWAGGLVVELPADGAAFQAITDQLPTSASAITTCGAGTPRVVINPAVLSQPADWLDSTLVHEAVHVATDSACVPAGSSLAWATEGLAESVAASTDPDSASRNHELVVAYLRDHPVPRVLPADLTDLTSYALAQLAVEQVQAKFGPASRDLLDRAVHDSNSVTATELRRVTGWYTAGLGRLAGSR